ncbi:MAG: OmpA family protein [Pseudomonadales bacterium]
MILRHCGWLLLWASVPGAAAEWWTPPLDAGWLGLAPEQVKQAPLGEAVERHLSPDEPVSHWVHDADVYAEQAGDRLETREVAAEQVETVKLTDILPPIRFESGEADIPPDYVEELRRTLASMRHRNNVRLHLVGHADDRPLSDRLAAVFGDNVGLSRERAGVVAEFFQNALGLPPEAISYEGVGDSQPIASNLSERGKAMNRRVEVEVWYDQIREGTALEQYVVAQELKRVKVCRIETVCQLRYQEGHSRRARIRNLVTPLHWDDDSSGVPPAFLEQVHAALRNLAGKDNLVVRFIGFTDDTPLTGRTERIYGTHLGLSKARAHRVALAVQEALELPTSRIDSDGRGASAPLASNDTAQGRRINRRIEVEFWHDDPLQELPGEPQLCPDAAGAELVTKVYDPPWGRIPPLQLDGGSAVVPPGYTDTLRRAMADVGDKTNVRLRFVGFTGNQRLDRRTARVYGDDVGLSAARARRAMEAVTAQLDLPAGRAEHEGRGYVHADDVVNAGFIQGDTSHVAVQVVYDELAVLDDYEGVDVTRITRELSAHNPFALNLMRITVDGEPIDDPGRSSADIQRCTDVALEQADIKFRFDNLQAARRLNVTARPNPLIKRVGSGEVVAPVRFRMDANYLGFIDRAEVRLFAAGQSLQADPLHIAAVDVDGLASWQPQAGDLAAGAGELQYVLRAYDAVGNFDETAPQPLWVVRQAPSESPAEPEPGPESADRGVLLAAAGDGWQAMGAATEPEGGAANAADFDRNGVLVTPPASAHPLGLLAGFGENRIAIQNIPVGGGTVKVQGSSIPQGHTVWVGGRPVPQDVEGRFAIDQILPSGMHTVEVAVLDDLGNGELFLRDLEFKRSDWFYMGIADLTWSETRANGPASLLQGDKAPYDYDSSLDGRFAFYLNGKFGDQLRLTASADTREGPLKDLFSNFMSKSPDSLFRRIDPDYHYPTFGDDGIVEETAPTQGKFYLKVERGDDHLLWGNFKVGYMGNELAQIDRGLYGANARYQSDARTAMGEARFVVDGFAAEPGTVPSREEFRGTGGSLYFLRRQDILTGSERVRIEVRDKDSGLVTGVVNLTPILDYDVDYLQGRILLAQPLASSVDDNLLVRSGAQGGDDAYLIVRYEYTPGFEDIDALATGGQGHYWVNDHLKIGLTANVNEEAGSDSSLSAADITLRKSTESWIKLQAARSEGLVSSRVFSDDGGFGFRGEDPLSWANADAAAWRADVSVGINDFFERGNGRATLYLQTLEAGYSAPGLSALRDTDNYGGTWRMSLTHRLGVAAKADWRTEDEGLETSAQEVDLDYRLTDRWSVSAGVRRELRTDNSPLVPLTQEEGVRTDGVVLAAYDPASHWRAYGFVQDTLDSTGTREANGRIGAGGSYQFADHLRLDGELSAGDLGLAGKLGTHYQHSERTSVYLNYALENERSHGGLTERRGNLVSGVRTRLADSSSVYLEERYQHSDRATGLSHATGVNFAPTQRMNLGANTEIGTLQDRQTGAETKRKAAGFQVGYGFERIQIASGIEYRLDENEQQDASTSKRTTWLLRNNFKYQPSPDWRIIGKLNHAESESSLGQFYDGGYTEAVIGYGFRPVSHDRLNALAKYTYFYNVPTTDQVSLQNTPVEFLQKSHVAAIDATYDISSSWSLGGKYAFRLGQVSLDRENPQFFDNRAHLYIVRADWRFHRRWDGMLEARMLELPDLGETRSGALVAIYRQLGDHVRVGVGYNFTDFSDDLTDLSFDHQGAFVNLVGKL